ncbi:MAG: VTT domain-containing protein [Tatlockia sp.]|jgi:membrane protein DedA with SNARE-associated domain
MHLFTDYIQPLIFWLEQHPHLALLITFLISFAESLAIIGSIIPGSVTMTAIGILAGSGVMRIDLTFIAAILGAVAGDIASYLLGYVYSDKLPGIWPFRRYPTWLYYGKEYFGRHGGKSVLLGRFVGPLRSIIPVIAGMMRMNKWRFIIANVISGVIWSVLYVMPGVLIGAASSELSPEVATRLFVLILVLLVSVWLMSITLSWLFVRLNRFLRSSLHAFWLRSSKNPWLAKSMQFLTPDFEANHYATAALIILFVLSTFFFVVLTVQVYFGTGLALLNQPIFLFLQSLRTHAFDVFFTLVSEGMSPITLITLVLSILCLTLYYRDQRALAYWLSLNIACALILMSVQLLIPTQEPPRFANMVSASSFPIPALTFATALFVSLVFYINKYTPIRFKYFMKTILVTCWFLGGLSFLYLGENWFTDFLGACLCGLAISLLHWLFFRRYAGRQITRPYAAWSIIFLLLGASSASALLNFNNRLREHQPYVAQYVFTDALWWNQQKPLLPIYRTNRIGRRISLFNIQYAGKLNLLEEALTAYGWQKQTDSLFDSLLKRVSGEKSVPELPLVAQLYLNKKPVLVMSYEPGNGLPTQILRIWRSNFHLQHFPQPIWLGSVHSRMVLNSNQPVKTLKTLDALIYVKGALAGFPVRELPFPARVSQQRLPAEVLPLLLLIREPHQREPKKE